MSWVIVQLSILNLYKGDVVHDKFTVYLKSISEYMNIKVHHVRPFHID